MRQNVTELIDVQPPNVVEVVSFDIPAAGLTVKNGEVNVRMLPGYLVKKWGS